MDKLTVLTLIAVAAFSLVLTISTAYGPRAEELHDKTFAIIGIAVLIGSLVILERRLSSKNCL